MFRQPFLIGMKMSKKNSIIQLSANVSFMSWMTNIGIISLTDTDQIVKVYLIDCGSSDDDAKMILDYLDSCFGQEKYKIEAVLITHAHYDHCGGLPYLTEKTGCKGWICEDEAFFMEKPRTIAEMCWGGTATHELLRGYTVPKAVGRKLKSDEILYLKTEKSSIKVELILLDGHSSAQTGFLITDTDGIKTFFVGDIVSGRNSLSKYWVQFLLDEARTKKSIVKLNEITADYYIPSHGDHVEEIEGLVELNMLAILETENLILKLLEKPKCFDDLMKELLDNSSIKMNLMRFALMGSTVRSYMTALYEEEKIKPIIIENRFCWQKC